MPNYRDAHVTLIIEPADGEPFAWFGGDASVYASSGEFDAKVVWLGQQEHVALSPAQLSSARAALAAAPATSAGFTLDDQGRRVHDGWDHDGDLIATFQGELGGMQARGNRVADAARGVTLRNGMLVGIDALTEAVEAWDEGVDTDDAHTETVTEYRVVGRSGPGMSVEVVEGYSEADIEMARDQARYCVEDGWVEVRVESRTVSTSRRESEWKATDQ